MNLNVFINDFDGQPLKLGDKSLTIASAIIHALMVTTDANQKDSSDVKIYRYRLASKVQEQALEVVLSAEDISFIKEQVAIVFSPLVVGRVFEVIDPACFQ